MLSQDMESETLLKTMVGNKIEEIEANIQTLRSLQSMLAGLLETPQEHILNYLNSFKIPDSSKFRVFVIRCFTSMRRNLLRARRQQKRLLLGSTRTQ
nr:hypothetical protein [Paenibacillus sp. OSY-SE]